MVPQVITHLFPGRGATFKARTFFVLKLTLVIIGLIAIAFAVYGIGPGGRFYFEIAKNPFRSFETAYWFHESILHTILAYALGFNHSHLSFSLFVLTFSPITLLYLGLQIDKRLPEGWVYFFLLVLTFHPLTLIHYTWVLHPDTFVALFTAVIFFSYSPTVIFVACVLGALAHASQFLVILLLSWLIRVTFEPDAISPIRLAAAGSIGWVVGKCLVLLYLTYFDIHIENTRLSIVMHPEWSLRVRQVLLNPWTTLYTLYAGYWLLIVALSYFAHRLSRRLFWAFLLSQIIAGTVTFVTYDTTRVFATLTWAPFIFCTVYVLNHLHGLSLGEGQMFRGILVGSLVLGILCPKLYSFNGAIWTMDETREYLQKVLKDAGSAQ